MVIKLRLKMFSLFYSPIIMNDEHYLYGFTEFGKEIFLYSYWDLQNIKFVWRDLV